LTRVYYAFLFNSRMVLDFQRRREVGGIIYCSGVVQGYLHDILSTMHTSISAAARGCAEKCPRLTVCLPPPTWVGIQAAGTLVYLLFTPECPKFLRNGFISLKSLTGGIG
jgi:hypothetical protein